MSGFWRRLDDTLAGMVPGSGGYMGVQDRRAERQGAMAQAQAAARQAEELKALMEQLAGNDPAKRYQMMVDPKGYAGVLNERDKPGVASEGQTIFGKGFGAAPTTVLPKTGFQGDVPFAQIGSDVTYGQARPQTYQEGETARANAAREAQARAEQERLMLQFAQTFGLDKEKLAETIRANKAREARPVGGISISLGGGGRPTFYAPQDVTPD